MKMLLLLTTVAALAGCAGSDVSYIPQTTATYPAIPPETVMVADRPPLGHYITIGMLSAEQHPGENLQEGVERFKEKAAAIGANYVWIVGVGSNQYIAPAISNTFGSANATASGQGYYDGYGNWVATGYGNSYGSATTISMPAHEYSLMTASGRALIVTSGSHDPDMSKPASIGNPNGM